MSCTEQEAQKKWCPFTRILGGLYIEGDEKARPASLGGGYNRLPHNGEAPRLPMQAACVASLCMMWQWVPNPSPNLRPQDERPKGFCGLSK